MDIGPVINIPFAVFIALIYEVIVIVQIFMFFGRDFHFIMNRARRYPCIYFRLEGQLYPLALFQRQRMVLIPIPCERSRSLLAGSSLLEARCRDIRPLLPVTAAESST